MSKMILAREQRIERLNSSAQLIEEDPKKKMKDKKDKKDQNEKKDTVNNKDKVEKERKLNNNSTDIVEKTEDERG